MASEAQPNSQMIQRHGVIGSDGEFIQLGGAVVRDVNANGGWFGRDKTVARELARRPQAVLINGGVQYQAHPGAEQALAGVVCRMIWGA